VELCEQGNKRRVRRIKTSKYRAYRSFFLNSDMTNTSYTSATKCNKTITICWN